MSRMTRVAAAMVALVAVTSLACRAEVIGPNLVQNPGFEELDDSGWPVGWRRMPTIYSVSEEVARGGERSLAWENDDPEAYPLCSTELDLARGHRYEYEVWVRTENLRGRPRGATVAVEWWAEDGGYIGGSYAAGVKGTSDWTLISAVTERIPEHAARITLICYVREGNIGRAWFDDCSVKLYRGPLVHSIATDLYRGLATGAEVQVRSGLNLVDYLYGPQDIVARLDVVAPDGTTVQTLGPRLASPTELRFCVPSATLPAGRYELVVEASTRDGELSNSVSTEMTRVDEMPHYRAWIDEHQRLILDGEPYFPLGTYWQRIGDNETSLVEEHLDIYEGSPFNCIMPYDSWDIDEAQLDMCHRRDIDVIFAVKNFYAGTHGIQTREEAREIIEEYVTRFRDHPAIMAWYINDELPAWYYDQLREHQLWLEELDPSRPTWSVTNKLAHMSEYLGTFDVIGTDPYPIPEQRPSKPLMWTRATVEGTLGLKPVWQVPQIFNKAAYHPDEAEKYRAPTLEEMRSMAWQCIAEGANGLVFYSFFDLWKVDRQGGDRFWRRWRDVTRMAAEIKRFEPVLLAVDPAMEPARVSAPTEFGWRVYGKDGRTYLVAVNADDRPVEATFMFRRPIARAEVLFRHPRVRVSGAEVHLGLDALEPTVIALTPGGGAEAWGSWKRSWRR
ncbi:MAG: hypothetical protein ACP5KN_16355 [Armatimonadota bacterium]